MLQKTKRRKRKLISHVHLARVRYHTGYLVAARLPGNQATLPFTEKCESHRSKRRLALPDGVRVALWEVRVALGRVAIGKSEGATHTSRVQLAPSDLHGSGATRPPRVNQTTINQTAARVRASETLDPPWVQLYLCPPFLPWVTWVFA